MYSFISWTVLALEDWKVSILIKNTGLGLEVFVSPITLSRLREWEDKELLIYHHITEVSQTLFWFENPLEKKVFKNLLKIDWIGWKAAINILWIWVNTLAKAIEESDDKLLSTIPWIGKKTALKIILEMKSKVWVDDLFEKDNKMELTAPRNKEIMESLIAMWYDKRKVEEAVKSIPSDIEDLKERMVYAIKMLSK
ncbi:MAG: Holliday junction ATP-dependent DNA helicase ruvA [uncultured bacterium (gcode 4)]|uniref:Holliday junction branch migration complex subunit RuvA n=1 Tax=uncultured bacterium (gcode 4) TaxID=1234023 RepID=K2GIR7_9BACT|nr:MAG: Holliday junction ATP-dependent DNA helicase ruvA [uncultured bacterium (gcode 4)]